MGFTKSRKEMIVDFPEEIIENIVVRLLVKSIGRCRCVCKIWYRLLKGDPRFIRMHLKHATRMNKFSIMLYSLSKEKSKDIYTICYDSLLSTICSDKNRKTKKTKYTDLVHIDYPFELKNTTGNGFWGSSNGFVCFSSMVSVKRKIRGRPFLVDVVVIWNPSTGEYQKLPLSPIVGKSSNIDYGFGYDYKIDNFKVVSLMDDDYEMNWCHVHVFTLGSNAWMPMEKIPYNVSSHEVPDMGRLPVNGALHWIAFRRTGKGISSKVILSFNLEKEEFKEMQFPEVFDKSYTTNLCVLEGSLCLLGHIYGVQVDLWELKNYGMENSWTKLFNIDIKQFGYIGYLMPLWRFENGEILLGFDRDGGFHTGLYNSEHQTFKALKFYGDMTSYSPSTSIYVESLHSPRGGTYLMPAEAEEENFDHKRLWKYGRIYSLTKGNKPRIRLGLA